MGLLFDEQIGALNMVRLADEEEEAKTGKVSFTPFTVDKSN
jgi:hypothetical protein